MAFINVGVLNRRYKNTREQMIINTEQIVSIRNMNYLPKDEFKGIHYEYKGVYYEVSTTSGKFYIEEKDAQKIFDIIDCSL